MPISFDVTNSQFKAYVEMPNYVEFQKHTHADFFERFSGCLLRPIQAAYGRLFCEFENGDMKNVHLQQSGSRIKEWAVWFFAITIFVPCTLLGMALRRFSSSHQKASKWMSRLHSTVSSTAGLSTSDIIEQTKKDGICTPERLKIIKMLERINFQEWHKDCLSNARFAEAITGTDSRIKIIQFSDVVDKKLVPLIHSCVNAAKRNREIEIICHTKILAVIQYDHVLELYNVLKPAGRDKLLKEAFKLIRQESGEDDELQEIRLALQKILLSLENSERLKYVPDIMDKELAQLSGGFIRNLRTEDIKFFVEALRKDPTQLKVLLQFIYWLYLILPGYEGPSVDFRIESEKIILSVLTNPCDGQLPLHGEGFCFFLKVFGDLIGNTNLGQEIENAFIQFMDKISAAAMPLIHLDKQEEFTEFLKNVLSVHRIAAYCPKVRKFNQMIAEAEKLRATNPSLLKTLYEFPEILRFKLFGTLSKEQFKAILNLIDPDTEKLKKLIWCISSNYSLDEAFNLFDIIREVYPAAFEKMCRTRSPRCVTLSLYRIKDFLYSGRGVAVQVSFIRHLLEDAIPRQHQYFPDSLNVLCEGLAHISRPEHMNVLLQSFETNQGNSHLNFLFVLLQQGEERKISAAFAAYWMLWEKYRWCLLYLSNTASLAPLLSKIDTKSKLEWVIDAIPSALADSHAGAIDSFASEYRNLNAPSIHYPNTPKQQYTAKQWLVVKILKGISAVTLTQDELEEFLLERPYIVPECEIGNLIFSREKQTALLNLWRELVSQTPQVIPHHLSTLTPLPPVLIGLTNNYAATSTEDYRLMTELQTAENLRVAAAHVPRKVLIL